ncbi:MAG: sulfotransferase [Bacteroidetes bacterium]|nr:sulfotransferase [Bacteroidota bacterium]
MITPKQLLKTIVPSRLRSQIRTELLSLRCQFYQKSLKEDPKLSKPIFIIGAPRSGTTLSIRLFSSHPEVANWSEAGRIWDPGSYDDPNADHFWSGDQVTNQAIERLHSRFECYRQIENKKRFVNKHPRNSVRIDYIRKIFPDALFIHVVRDGRAVVNSIINRIERDSARQKVPFGDFCKPPSWQHFLRDDPVEQAALQWREIVSYVLSKRNELGSCYYQFKYEDLCVNPRKTLRSAFKFADMAVSEDIWSTFPETFKNMNYKYKEIFADTQISTINSIQIELLKELGYET